MPMATDTTAGYRPHGHHKVAAAIFVGSLILGSAIVLAAELTKPPRYEYRPGADPSSYVLFDADTGRSTMAKVDSKNPTDALETK
ncbi:MAG TPA: hypothetical protein VH107_17745 [Lacipirellulaceae bacterium]|nr:hypothetical protein [Lacipirellulaceae bacterium]